ncbi:MAG: right-handed parallel beta-helix repeat-containing protein [Candidatus Thermoplasmatota archaeon]|nr:right-handed parallel beta-helix repeat-containing protein [Candidatus Thermoplasmatota archaeon]MBU4591441.1 right-handed parallel beta-helix repeat-containing protein [Candidatus Thermoplasmatota archaeon]
MPVSVIASNVGDIGNGLSPVINIDTGEDFNTIQEAINAVNTTDGHTITVDAGTYNENVIVNKKLSIEGAGMDTTTINGGGSGSVVTITANWVNITGFKITGSGTAGSTPNIDAGVKISTVQYCNISGNNLTGNRNGVNINSGGYHKISGNQIRTNGYDGIFADSSTYNRIDNNTIIGFTDRGIWLRTASSNGIIDNNTISTGPYGLYIGSGTTSNTVIKWNTITKTTNYGMYLSGNTGSKITWNQVRSNTGTGITLSGSSSNSITNNTLLWNNGTAGIALEGGSANNDVSYNKFWNNIRNGIRFASSGSGNRVTFNNFTNNAKSGSVYDAAVHLYQWSNYNIIANNSLFDNRYSLSGGSGCDYNTFDNNTVTYTTAYGIILGYSNYNTFKYNTVRNGLSGGAASGNAQGNVFIHNNISSNTGNGIAISQGGKHKILNNTITYNTKTGVNITGSSVFSAEQCIIDGNNVSFNGGTGIHLWDSTSWSQHVYETTVTNNIVVGNALSGIELIGGTYKNTLTGNNVSQNLRHGISLKNAPDTTVWNNTVSENAMYGIYVSGTSSSKIYHNNLIDNANQAYEDGDNIWNLAYAGGGNYWSEWTSPDDFSGSNQDIGGSDGYVDNPRIIPGGTNQDDYPWTTKDGWIGYTPTTGPVINTDTSEFFFFIQEAINDSDTLNGHTITVAAGMYFENIVVNKRLSIIGDGASTTTIKGGGTGNVVTITASWVNITGFKIMNGGSAGDSAGIRMSTVQYANISACNITGNLKHGIFVSQGSSNTIYGSTISNNSGNGIYCSNSPSNKIIGNTIEGNLGPEGGMYLYYSSQTIISYNVIRNHPQSGVMTYYANYNKILFNDLSNNSKATSGYVYRSGIHLYQHTGYNTIANNTLHDNRIGLGTQYNVNYNTWDNNTVSYSSSSGMVLSYASNNLVKYNAFHHNAGSGISSGNSDLNTISRNNVFSNTGDGISLSVGRHKFLNNTVTNNGFSGINVTGNSGSGATPLCLLDGNNVSYNNRDGITLWDSTSWSYHVYFTNVTNNIVYGNNRTGINLVGGTYTNTIRGNIVKGNLRYGIGLNNAPTCRILNNTIEGNLNHGMYVTSTSNSRIYHNNFLGNAAQAYDSGTTNRWNATYPNGGNYWSDHIYPDHFNDTARPQTTGGPDWFNDINYAIPGGLSEDAWPHTWPRGWLQLTPVHNLDAGTDYAMISEALQFANPGDRLQIEDRIYNENVTIDSYVQFVNSDFTLNGSLTVDAGQFLNMKNVSVELGTVIVNGALAVDNSPNTIKSENVWIDGSVWLNSSTWEMDCAYDGEYNITVNGTGEMYIQDAPPAIGTGLIGQWLFDEGTGQTVEDTSVNTNDGSLGSTPATEPSDPVWIEGINGDALFFDGADDFVGVDSAVIPAAGDFSVSVWAKPDSGMTGYREILSQGWNTNAFYIGMDDITNNIRAGDGWPDTGIPFPLDDVWHMFTVTKTGADTVLYLDGIPVANKGGTIPNPLDTNFKIGLQYNGGEYFHGGIDEVHVFDRALTSGEIFDMYNTTPVKGSVIKASSTFNYGFNVLSGATFCVENSTIQDAGWNADNPGLVVNTTNAYFNVANLSNNYNGLTLKNSSATVRNSIISNNVAQGICIASGTSNPNHQILNNDIMNNGGNGIYLGTDNNTITGNTIDTNTGSGIYLTGSNNNIINNTISNNAVGVELPVGATGNTIIHNNILSNTQQAVDGGSQTWNLSYDQGGNYWDDWETPDINWDGFVDAPYIIDGDSVDYWPHAVPFGWTNWHPGQHVLNWNQGLWYPTLQSAVVNATDGDTLMPQDWTFVEDVTVDGKTIYIQDSSFNLTGQLVIRNGGSLIVDPTFWNQTGNVWVESDGTLTLINTTLRMNNAFNGQYNITVNTTGTLQIIDGGIGPSKVMSNTTFAYGIYVNSGAFFKVENSTIRDAGWNVLNPGLVVNADGAYLYNATLTANYKGIQLVNSNNSMILNSLVTQNAHDGILVRLSNNVTIDGTNVTNNLRYGIFFSDSTDGRLSDSNVSNNMNQGVNCLLAHRTNISNVDVWSNTQSGVIIQLSDDVTVTDCNINDNNYGIYLTISQGTIIDNCQIINNNLNGIEMTGGTSLSTIQNNVLIGNNNGLYLNNAPENTIDNNLIDNSLAAGLVVVDTTTTIPLTLNEITNNPIGVSSQNSEFTLENCTFITNALEIQLDLDSHITTLNSTFNKALVTYADALSTLEIQWFMSVYVRNNLLQPVPGAQIEVSDAFNTALYDVNADGSGKYYWMITTEYIEKQSGQTPYTPHLLIGNNGILMGAALATMDVSKLVTLIIDQTAPMTNVEVTSGLQYDVNGADYDLLVSLTQNGQALPYKAGTTVNVTIYDDDMNVVVNEEPLNLLNGPLGLYNYSGTMLAQGTYFVVVNARVSGFSYIGITSFEVVSWIQTINDIYDEVTALRDQMDAYRLQFNNTWSSWNSYFNSYWMLMNSTIESNTTIIYNQVNQFKDNVTFLLDNINGNLSRLDGNLTSMDNLMQNYYLDILDEHNATQALISMSWAKWNDTIYKIWNDLNYTNLTTISTNLSLTLYRAQFLDFWNDYNVTEAGEFSSMNDWMNKTWFTLASFENNLTTQLDWQNLNISAIDANITWLNSTVNKGFLDMYANHTETRQMIADVWIDFNNTILDLQNDIDFLNSTLKQMVTDLAWLNATGLEIKALLLSHWADVNITWDDWYSYYQGYQAYINASLMENSTLNIEFWDDFNITWDNWYLYYQNYQAYLNLTLGGLDARILSFWSDFNTTWDNWQLYFKSYQTYLNLTIGRIDANLTSQTNFIINQMNGFENNITFIVQNLEGNVSNLDANLTAMNAMMQSYYLSLLTEHNFSQSTFFLYWGVWNTTSDKIKSDLFFMNTTQLAISSSLTEFRAQFKMFWSQYNLTTYNQTKSINSWFNNTWTNLELVETNLTTMLASQNLNISAVASNVTWLNATVNQGFQDMYVNHTNTRSLISAYWAYFNSTLSNMQADVDFLNLTLQRVDFNLTLLQGDVDFLNASMLTMLNRLSTVEVNLTAMMNGMNATMLNQLAIVNLTLYNRIQTLQTTIQANLTSINASLQTRLNDLDAMMTTFYNSLNESLVELRDLLMLHDSDMKDEVALLNITIKHLHDLSLKDITIRLNLISTNLSVHDLGILTFLLGINDDISGFQNDFENSMATVMNDLDRLDDKLITTMNNVAALNLAITQGHEELASNINTVADEGAYRDNIILAFLIILIILSLLAIVMNLRTKKSLIKEINRKRVPKAKKNSSEDVKE